MNELSFRIDTVIASSTVVARYNSDVAQPCILRAAQLIQQWQTRLYETHHEAGLDPKLSAEIINYTMARAIEQQQDGLDHGALSVVEIEGRALLDVGITPKAAEGTLQVSFTEGSLNQVSLHLDLTDGALLTAFVREAATSERADEVRAALEPVMTMVVTSGMNALANLATAGELSELALHAGPLSDALLAIGLRSEATTTLRALRIHSKKLTARTYARAIKLNLLDEPGRDFHNLDTFHRDANAELLMDRWMEVIALVEDIRGKDFYEPLARRAQLHFNYAIADWQRERVHGYDESYCLDTDIAFAEIRERLDEILPFEQQSLGLPPGSLER